MQGVRWGQLHMCVMGEKPVKNVFFDLGGCVGDIEFLASREGGQRLMVGLLKYEACLIIRSRPKVVDKVMAATNNFLRSDPNFKGP